MTTQVQLEQFKKKIEEKLHNTAVYGFSTDEMFIAGGCIRSIVSGEEPKDIDVFFKDSTDLEIVREYFKIQHPSSFISDNAVTLTIDGLKYQFITTCQGTPNGIVGEFDFTMNMNFFDFANNELYINDMWSITTKQLKVNLNCRNKLGTLARISKFVARGYKIPSQMNLLELGVQLTRQSSVENFETLQEKSKLYISEDNYNGLSVVSNFRPYKEVAKSYKGSAV